MKRLFAGVLAMVSLLMIVGPTAHAAPSLTISGPHAPGEQFGAWFKDSLTISLSGKCNNGSKKFNFDYSSNRGGAHTYTFHQDNLGNPYVTVDSQSVGYTSLGNTPCGSSIFALFGGMTNRGTVSGSVDNRSPQVNLTSPANPVTTTESTYPISGTVSDTEGNLASVKTIVNGVAGPAATITGNKFAATVPLGNGVNNVQVIAYDTVGHSIASNTARVTTTGSVGQPAPTGQSQAGGGGGVSTSPSASPSGNGNAPKNNEEEKTPVVNFGEQQVLSLDDPYADTTSDPTKVQEESAIAGVTGISYVMLIIITIGLFALCVFVLFRFKPIFSALGQNKAGLRRRILIVVTLPSVIPLLGLGFLGYQQLSDIVKNSLSSQLDKASQTSALKLQREFGIRNTVITKTSSDVLQIKSQYADQKSQLAKQKIACQQVVQANVPTKQIGKVTSDTNCLPFLGSFAQLNISAAAKVGDYQNALNQGAERVTSDLIAQENERVNELLESIRDYFPDILELDIVDTAETPNLVALLPRTDPKHETTVETHRSLIDSASSGNLALVDTQDKQRQLLLTYPIRSGKALIGGAVAAIDTGKNSFIADIWRSTPKPYASDEVYFVTKTGDVVVPQTTDGQVLSQMKKLADNGTGKVFELKKGDQVLATRTTAVPNTNWVVAVGAPASTILAPLAGIQFTAIIAIVAFIFLSILLGIWFVSGIAGEIEKLFKGAQNYARGNLDYKIDLHSEDELQMLGDTMNQMASEIKGAQAALVQKDKEFIDVATHELRAPMTAILGYLSMVVDDKTSSVDKETRELIDKAFVGTQRLRDIVNDLLDVAKLESGHANFRPVAVDIEEVVRAVIEMQSVVAKEAQVELSYKSTGQLPKISADKKKLEVILTNLISNAIKYNHANGTVTISHRTEGDKLVTSISDTGLGIPEDQKIHMFEKFYRIQDQDRADIPGTGLGLHITKRFIEGMGGQVRFESLHGKGTTFHFDLPLYKEAPAVEPEGVTSIVVEPGAAKPVIVKPVMPATPDIDVSQDPKTTG